MTGEVRQAVAELDEALPALGSVFESRFEIEQVLGRGGMGCVLLARHLELEQQVALKLLRPGRGDSERGALRLLREARASARIKSEHVVRVRDVVSRQKAAPYIVMEYLQGSDLARSLARQGPLGVRDAAAIVIQACEAVGEGHRLGIVHRDLKPSNLFLCERSLGTPFVKVLDFGISKTEDDAELLTQSHALLGSPVYSAPEQLQSSRAVDARADIWSLGVILYECVTAARPFAGGSLAQVCTQILQEAPVPLERHREDLPADFRALVLRCLEKSPADRFGSVEALVDALAPFAPAQAKSTREYLDGLPAAPRGTSDAPRASSASSSDTLTGSAEYDTGAARARRHAQFRAGWLFWAAAVAVALTALWVYRRMTATASPSLDVSAAAPPVSLPLPASSLPVPSSAAAPSSVPVAGTPAAAIGSAPTGAVRKAPRKPPAAPGPAPAPWVESR